MKLEGVSTDRKVWERQEKSTSTLRENSTTANAMNNKTIHPGKHIRGATDQENRFKVIL